MAQETGTDTQETTAQEGSDTSPADGSTATDTAPRDEVTVLRSRNAGLDAKVTALTQAQKAAEQRAADALAKLEAYEAKTVGSDEALRAQLDVSKAELAAARQETALARIAAAYPETFAVLGEAAANLSPEKLAEAEARFRGVPPEEPAPIPRPIGNNQSRSREKPAETSGDDIEAQLRTMTLPWRQ